MDELAVVLGGIEIGTLMRTRKGARFAYAPEIAARMPGLPLLSVSLPVKKRPYSEGLTGSWFSGLLPEGARLDAVCDKIGCHRSDYFSVLEEIGAECAGAVSIRKRQYMKEAPTGLKPLDESELAEALSDIAAYEYEQRAAYKMSLGGFQDKLCLTAVSFESQRGEVSTAVFANPTNATPSTHILKPQPADRYDGMIEAEAWALECASEAARCSRASLLKLDGAPAALVSERFDRVREGGTITRVHQEDCCQALGLDPERKYASTRARRGDDPSFAKIASLLVGYAEEPGAELEELFKQMTVNIMLGNLDAHAKNYSFLYAKQACPTLAPMYDLVPVSVIEPAVKHLSLRVNGKLLESELAADDLVAEGVSWGMSRPSARRLVNETAEAISGKLGDAGNMYPGAAAKCEREVKARMAKYARSNEVHLSRSQAGQVLQKESPQRIPLPAKPGIRLDKPTVAADAAAAKEAHRPSATGNARKKDGKRL